MGAGKLLLALVLSCAWQVGWAAASATVTFVSNLSFGDFTVLGSCVNCSITIDPATGMRSASGGVILRSSNAGQRGQYTVKMSGCGQSCSYTATVTPASLNMVTAGGTMTVDTFATNQTALTGSNGSNTLYVGGTLRIPSVNVTAGSYSSASFTVTTTP